MGLTCNVVTEYGVPSVLWEVLNRIQYTFLLYMDGIFIADYNLLKR